MIPWKQKWYRKKQGGSEVGVTCNYVDGQAAGWVPAAHIVPAVELKPSTQAEVWPAWSELF